MPARVASIHYAPVKADRSIYGGMYALPAVPLAADPAIIVIQTLIQKDEGPVSTGPGHGQRQQLRYPVEAFDIAQCIVREWTQMGMGMTPQCHPGIWVVRDRFPIFEKDEKGQDRMVRDAYGLQAFKPATPLEEAQMFEEDLAMAREADRAYADWCYLDGNRWAYDVRLVPFIPKHYKLACAQYMAELPNWAKDGAAKNIAPCPNCGKPIFRNLIVCPDCHNPVDLARYAQLKAAEAMAIARATELLQGSRKGGTAMGLKTPGEPVPAGI